MRRTIAVASALALVAACSGSGTHQATRFQIVVRAGAPVAQYVAVEAALRRDSRVHEIDGGFSYSESRELFLFTGGPRPSVTSVTLHPVPQSFDVTLRTPLDVGSFERKYERLPGVSAVTVITAARSH